MGASTLARCRDRYVRLLEEDLEQIVAQLSRMSQVRLVVLFGSYAAGRRDLLTDLDTLVVMDSPLDFVTRTAELYRRLSPRVDLDLLVYTPEELEANRTRPFFRRILEKGRVLYERGTA